MQNDYAHKDIILKFNHPNIIKTFVYVKEEEEAYLVIEQMRESCTLSNRLRGTFFSPSPPSKPHFYLIEIMLIDNSFLEAKYANNSQL